MYVGVSAVVCKGLLFRKNKKIPSLRSTGLRTIKNYMLRVWRGRNCRATFGIPSAPQIGRPDNSGEAGACLRMDRNWTASCQPTRCVPHPRRWQSAKSERKKRDEPRPERRVYDSKTGIKIFREKVLEGRNAEVENMINHHVFDDVPESAAVREKLIRAKWLNDDRGEKARHR